MAFPTLFPYGHGDPTDQRTRKVSLSDAFKHLVKYGEKMQSGQFTWRFASHPRFPYWALNMKLRHQLLSQSRIYFHQNTTDVELTIDKLRAMVVHNSPSIMNKIERYTEKIQGTRSYWVQRHQELRALPEQKGPPTFFWTVSSADNYWPELHSLMPHPPDQTPTHQMRVQAVITHPHITDWYFTSKLADLVHHWLYGVLDAEWHWYRFEYQAQGSTHAHGCAKLKNDPGIVSLVKEAAAGWLAAQSQDQDQGVIEAGETAKSKALEYSDWLVTTINDSMPDDSWMQPTPHPCTIKLNTPCDATDEDYHGLVNSVQRHTRCSTAYCLRRKGENYDLKCHFYYPRTLQSFTTLEFEKLDSGAVRATLLTRRNDPRVNSHG